MHNKMQLLFEKALRLPPIPAGIICPESGEAMLGIKLAYEQKSIVPFLFGDLALMEKIAREVDVNLGNFSCFDLSEKEALSQAIAMTRAGELKALMKGSLHTDEFMGAIVSADSGLRAGRRMSHCMLVDVPLYKKLFVLTDAALNIKPGVKEKKDIIQNAIDLSLAIGVAKPKIAILSAVETVNQNMQSTLDAQKLVEMAREGQFIGGIVEGPLSFDLAISEKSAEIKKIKSEVAGDADILIVPDLDSGNILSKALDYFADAYSFGLVLGAKVPAILVSRAASADNRAGSCMLAKLYMEQSACKLF